MDFSEILPIFFSAIQAVFMVMMFLAVRSFFPVWYKAFKKAGRQPLRGSGTAGSDTTLAEGIGPGTEPEFRGWN